MSVCERGRERESVCVCVREGERESVSVCERGREREREAEHEFNLLMLASNQV